MPSPKLRARDGQINLFPNSSIAEATALPEFVGLSPKPVLQSPA
jgi:hypothetical protein